MCPPQLQTWGGPLAQAKWELTTGTEQTQWIEAIQRIEAILEKTRPTSAPLPSTCAGTRSQTCRLVFRARPK